MVIVFSSQEEPQDGSNALELTLLKGHYSILRFDPASRALGSLLKVIPSSSCSSSPMSSGVSPDSALFNISVSCREISLVGPTSAMFSSDGRWRQSNVCNPQAVESGWMALRVEPPSTPTLTTGSGNPALGDNYSVEKQKERGESFPPGIDFSVVGIMARISGILARAGVSLFAISTFDTDYLLVKEEKVEVAVQALQEDGCRVTTEDLEREALG